MPLIRVAAVVFTDSSDRLLTVRKRGTSRFMLPGGKPEPGEEFIDTAAREVAEELGLKVSTDDLHLLNVFESDAANEPGHSLESHVYIFEGELQTTPRVAAEIEELRWLSDDEIQHPPEGLLIAPMLQFHAAPAVFG